MLPPTHGYPTYTLQQVQSFLGQQALFATLCEPHGVPELPLEQKHKSMMGYGCSLLTTRLPPISRSKLRNLQRPAGDDGTEYTLQQTHRRGPQLYDALSWLPLSFHQTPPEKVKD